ncbi:aspartyl-tRNA(Asn)/glutamyl-tRNA(Gln) amidotransferase subunit A [Modicisalibacter ilicicola DSM 19980]|uniref:Aspartyl-tRNA(Asn)/glutamyl-tRNA(Gln) amidotransferase subunit A n=1 Tax=Modicisalibacter ilicicola DSM 19980 TaxID=1121942 RepID=A0A1M4TD12_9GAMM|nr:amidase [Halomonas ilicicola]SHE42157.1 aspartyl-tRNA(Asn)/glutamyl-tRNA(Gln) amidotransferase subunit A [Halomonas ilicicola DSM 19980]
MSDTDLGLMDAGRLAELFGSGEASPLEATRAALERIERFNDKVNAYVYVDHEGAEAAAKASARRWGQGKPLSPIDGVPVSLKDLTNVAGMPAREGSLLTSDAHCEEDAPPARMLREAGAVLLGKTNTPEFGWKAVTDNRVFGATCNPWDTRLTPGGSSGGAAAAAALNLGVLHQGGDSGGSIRIPAAFTGVFGFKPTFGWTPQWPPAKEPTLSHIGPLTRSVRDAARMLNVIGRYDYRDPYATRGQPEDWGVDLDNDLRGLRIAYSPDLGYAKVDSQIAERVREAARKLEALGAEIVEIDPGFESPIKTFQTLWFTASLELWSQCSEEQRQRLDPGLVANARHAENWLAVDLFRALADRARLTQQLEHFNQEYHLLMTPSVPLEPFEVNHEVPPGSDMRDWEEWAPFSYPFNLSQQPAASVPCGFTDKGLPVGFQLAGGKFDDIRVLRACNAFMEAHPPRFPTVPDPAHYG